MFSFSVRRYGEYPCWAFREDNPLLDQAVAIHTRLFGREPEATGVHGGLECGVLSEKYPELAMLSIGPTLTDVHTPRERVELASIGNFVQLVVTLVSEVR